MHANPKTSFDGIAIVAHKTSYDCAEFRLAGRLAQAGCTLNRLLQFHDLLVQFTADQSWRYVPVARTCKVVVHEIVYCRLEQVGKADTVEFI